ncbi:unnamed protein product [Urochloa humidicola]
MASAGEPTGSGGTEAEINQELPSLVVKGLISNSLDALDEMKAKLGQSAQLYGLLRAVVTLNKAAMTLTVSNNGIGMTRSDLYRHLGAVARLFGTKGFMEALLLNTDASKSDLGLCYAYLIADKVVITAKHDDDQQYQYVWEGDRSFTVRLDVDGERLDRGTKITLHLKENHFEYLAERCLKDLVEDVYKCPVYPIDTWTEEEGEEEEIIDNEGDASTEEEEEEIIDDEGDASTEEEEEEIIDDEGDITTEEEGEEEEVLEDTIDDDGGVITEEEDEAMHKWRMQIRKQDLLSLRALEEISGQEYPSWYKSMAKGLLDDNTKWIETLKIAENKNGNSSLYDDEEDSEEDSLSARLATSGGDEYSEEDSTTSGDDQGLEQDFTTSDNDEDSEQDNARLAGHLRYHSTTSSGGGDMTGGRNDHATRAVEGQMGGKAPVPAAANKGGRFSSAAEATLPEHEPWRSTCATEPGPSSSNGFTPLFKLQTMGKCYNCLRSDHFVASCSFPTRCLLCHCEGHIARSCALLYEYRGPGAPHRRLAWVRACAPFSDAMRASSSRSGVTAAGVAAPVVPVLLYKARVCVEGVPTHARQLETVAGLFAGGFALVESLDDDDAVADKEAACVRVWVWTRDPDTVARAGTLLIQEPRGPTWPSVVHSDLGLTGYSMSAAGPPQMVEYEVIIHLDRVYDYTPAPGSTAGGLLWPRCHVFSWSLGVLDGAAPPPRTVLKQVH